MATSTRNADRVKPGQVWASERGDHIFRVLSDFYSYTMYGVDPDDEESMENTVPFEIEVCDVERLPAVPDRPPGSVARDVFEYGYRLMQEAPDA